MKHPPTSIPSNVISLDEYRGTRDSLLHEELRFVAYISGQMPYDDLDALIEDLIDSGVDVESVFIVTGECEEGLPTPAND